MKYEVIKPKKGWTWAPARKKSKVKILDSIKTAVKLKADDLIENVLKPRFIKPPLKNSDLNYLADIFSKWHGTYFYFCSTYNCPGPNAMSPFFNTNFARLEYIGPNKFNLAFIRHTGQWVEIEYGLSVDECLDNIENNSIFFP